MGMIVVAPVVMVVVRMPMIPFIRGRLAPSADPHHMMVVTLLRGSDFILVTDDLFAVFAELTIHVVLRF